MKELTNYELMEVNGGTTQEETSKVSEDRYIFRPYQPQDPKKPFHIA